MVDTVYKSVLENGTFQSGSSGWKLWPEKATEDAIIEWFLGTFNIDILPHSPVPVKYMCHKSRGNTQIRLANGILRRQPDIIFMRPQAGCCGDGDNGNPADHDWKEVLVVGKLTQGRAGEYSEASDVLWLAGFVREVFYTQPGRSFVHGFLLRGDVMRAFRFNRAGGIGSEAFSINNQPEMFLRLDLPYATMGREDIGLDPEYPDVTEVRIPEGGKRTIYIGKTPIFRRLAISSRASTCWMGTYDANRAGYNLVVKEKWKVMGQKPEGELLAAAKGVFGVAAYDSHEDVLDSSGEPFDIMGSVRRGIMGALHTTTRQKTDPCQTTNRPEKHTSHPQHMSSKQTGEKRKFKVEPDVISSQNRTLTRVVMSSIVLPLTSFDSHVQLLRALKDAIKGRFPYIPFGISC